MTAKDAILIVEDDEVNRRFLARFFTAHGYDVTAVETGEEGLGALGERRYGLMLLDLMLPGINGGEVAWAARERGFDRPILAVSAAMHPRATRSTGDRGGRSGSAPSRSCW